MNLKEEAIRLNGGELPIPLSQEQRRLLAESQANRTYLAFAKKAEAEGHPQIAKLFRAAAAAETDLAKAA